MVAQAGAHQRPKDGWVLKPWLSWITLAESLAEFEAL